VCLFAKLEICESNARRNKAKMQRRGEGRPRLRLGYNRPADRWVAKTRTVEVQGPEGWGADGAGGAQDGLAGSRRIDAGLTSDAVLAADVMKGGECKRSMS
jgi:hypothetical protein